jgi:hypothetical protein
MQNRPCDVTPTNEQDKYAIALIENSGRWWGIDAPLSSIIPTTLEKPESLLRVGFQSYHQGRGQDKHIPDSYGFYDGHNLWSTTQGKAHATQLFQWAKGLRSTDTNMPNANGVVWKKLSGSTAFLLAPFTASASYTVDKVILIIRKNVPAGTVGAPGNLVVSLWTADGSDHPSVFIDSDSVTAAEVDTTSTYFVFDISGAVTSGTRYVLQVNANSDDKSSGCWEVGCDPTVAGVVRPYSGGGSYSTSTYSPYYRITDADTARTFKIFTWDDALYLVSIYADATTTSRLFINGVRGRAVGTQTSTTLQDTGHGTYGATNWPTDRFAGAYVRIIRGAGKGQVRQIASNTADTLTVTVAWEVTPVAASSEYVVFACDWFYEIGDFGLVVTNEPCIQNGTVYFPIGDSTDMMIMRMDYTDADDHATDRENTNHNKATFLTAGYDVAAGGPMVWRANLNATTGSTPNAAAISVSRAPSAPLVSGLPTPLAFGTDLTFGRAIPCGDNTNLINGIIFNDNALHVLKDDSIFIVQGDVAAQIKIGTDRAPRRTNGMAAAVGSDKQLYIGFLSDIYLITGGGVYSTQMKNNLPSDRSGYAASIAAGEGWMFAAIDAGASGTSSIMKYSIDTQSWSEQLRAFSTGRRMRSVTWQDCAETRPRLWMECEGEILFQEFPINGTRPYDDSGLKYQHEGVLVLPTIDLNNVDPKYFATLTVTSQGLAQEGDTEAGHEIVVEYQTDNDVGSSNWLHGGYIRVSPSGSVNLNVGNTRMLRPRLRLISNEATDPVILESIGLTLFSRNRLSHQWQVYFQISGDDEEQNGLELLRWLRDAYGKAEPLRLYSRFALYHDRRVTLTDEPYYRLDELDPEASDIEANIGITLREIL